MSNAQQLSDNPTEWPVEVHEALDYLISQGFSWQDYKAALELQQTYDAAYADYIAQEPSDTSTEIQAPSSPAEVGQGMDGEGE